MKFALVNTEPLELNRVVSSCWIPLLSRDGDEWEEFRAYEGQLPARESLDTYAGLVLTGSSCSPMQTDEWILEMKAWLKAVKEEQERRPRENPLRVLASCFSCQLTAATFGGAVAKNFVGHYIAKAEDLRVRPALLTHKWATALETLPTFSGIDVPHKGEGEEGNDLASTSLHMRVWESHGILVSRLPLGACRLADSPSSPNEIYTMGPDWLGKSLRLCPTSCRL